MDRDTLRARLYSKIDEIPTLPVVVPKILRLIEDERTGGAAVAAVVSRDTALTAKLLKVANSAYYGFSQRIATLEQAVPLLGFTMVKSLTLSVGVIHALPSGGGASRFSRAGVWIHSLAVATAMERVGRRVRSLDGRDHLFVLGLLHDVGKIVLFEYFPDLFEQAVRQAEESPGTGLARAERGAIGFDHGEVGAMLLGRWRFPKAIHDVIEVHHHDEVPDTVDAVDLAVLRLADAIAQELGMGESAALEPPAIRPGDLDTLAIGEADLDDVRTHLDNARQGIQDFFRSLS